MINKPWMIKCIVFVLIILMIAGVEAYFHYRQLHPQTEDATLDAQYVQVSSLVNGTVQNVLVKESSFVKKGQLLFSLDPTPYQLEYNAASAKLKMMESKLQGADSKILAAQASLNKAKSELDFTRLRVQKILALVATNDIAQIKGAEAKTELKAAEEAYESAKHQLNAAKYEANYDSTEKPEIQVAKAELKGAEYKLQHTNYYSPIDGVVTNISLYTGDIIGAGRPLFVVINPADYWVVANYSEKKLSRLKIGQPATITLDMYPHVKFTGKIISINYSSGSSFSLLPSQSSSENWVKTSQRFPVKISISQIDPEKYPLRIGASCEVVINTTGS